MEGMSYVCRTCLFVSPNEFSFKKLEKVKDVLKSYIPEIKNLLVANSIVCEQCYQFLKCMKKFKEKCLESQHRLCNFNVSNISQNNNRAIAEARWQMRPPPSYLQQSFNPISENTRGEKRPAERISVIDYASTNDNLYRDNLPLHTPQRHQSASNAMSTSALAVMDLSVKCTNLSSNPSTTALRSMRKAKKKRVQTKVTEVDLVNCPDDSNITATTPKNNKNTSTSANNTIITSNTTPKCLKNLSSRISSKCTPKKLKNLTVEEEEIFNEMPILTSNDDSDLEIVEIDDEEAANGNCVELKIRRKSVIVGETCTSPDPEMAVENNSATVLPADLERNNNDVSVEHHNEFEDMPVLVKVKEEAPEEQNPGFFNKKNVDGLYVCRMCSKVYKTSKGLYNHTKDIHSKDLKFFHCGFCSFFTLWRSALRRHCLNYHAKPTRKSSNKIARQTPAGKDVIPSSLQEMPTLEAPVDVDNMKNKKVVPASKPEEPTVSRHQNLEAKNDKFPLPLLGPILTGQNNIARSSEQQKKTPSPPNVGKLNNGCYLVCHQPNCNFHTLSTIILNQHLITRHNLYSCGKP